MIFFKVSISANVYACPASPTAMKKNYQTFAKIVAAIEFASFPLLIVAFVLLNQITSVALAMGADLSSPPDIGVLERQYIYLASHGLVSPNLVCALRLFGFFILLCAVVVPLRLISGPGLFDVVDWRRIAKKANSSTFRLVALGVIFGLGCIWSSLDLESSSRLPVAKVIIFSWPGAFVGLEALSFVFGMVSLVETCLGCIQLFLTQKNKLISISSGDR